MNKNEIAYVKIKEMIFRGVITSNCSISENSLVEKLGISRTPIRAALQRLKFEGILKIIPNQGIVIHEPSIEEAREKIELRVAVELYILKKCINLICEEDIENLHEIVDLQCAASKRGDFFEVLQCDKEFHTYLLKFYKNEIMTEIMLNFRERFFNLSLRGLAKRTATRMKETLEEHRNIISALEKHDFEEASDLLERHIENSFLELLKIR